jgi:DNA adenine methylase
MRYLGGKSKTWKQIVEFLESVRKEDQTYIEPFVGGAWVLQGMSGKRVASDANKALITLYKNLQEGWVPPTDVDEGMYAQLKKEQDSDNPLTAFVGFGVSFGGKWFGGFARSNVSRNYASNAKNSLMKQLPKIQDAEFSHMSYLEYEPQDSLVYCDPPYEGTTGYDGVGSFDSNLFWDTMRKWAKNNTVVISEYNAPDDFVCVKEMPTKTDMHTKTGKEQRVEKLFMYKG